MVRLQLLTTGGCLLLFVPLHWIFCCGLTSIWPCLCLGFIQPAAARLLSPRPRTCCHIPFLPPASAPLWVTQCVWVSTVVPLLGHLLRSQPTQTLPDLLLSNREMNMSHPAKPSCHIFSEAENEVQEKKPTHQRIQKKRKTMRYDASVSSYCASSLRTIQTALFHTKTETFSASLSFWESWFYFILFYFLEGAPSYILQSFTFQIHTRWEKERPLSSCKCQCRLAASLR